MFVEMIMPVDFGYDYTPDQYLITVSKPVDKEKIADRIRGKFHELYNKDEKHIGDVLAMVEKAVQYAIEPYGGTYIIKKPVDVFYFNERSFLGEK